VRISCSLPPGPGAPGHAALAETLGYARAWFYDSPALYGDVWIAMARALDRTERIGVGTAVLVPSLRHVVTTAAAIGSLEAQAPGRLAVAIGTGFTGRRLFGQKPLALAHLREYVGSLRGLLRGEEVLVDGKVCKLMHPDGLIAKRPIDTPLLVAVSGEKSLALAREVGDGLMCVGVVPEGARGVTFLTFGTVLDAGEDFASDRVLDAVGAAIAVVYHGTYEAAGAGVDALPGGAGWREEVERFPLEVRHLYVHEGHCFETTARDRRHMSPELGATTFTGTAEQLRARRDALEDQGVEEIVYAPLGPDVPRELRAMAEALR
jgi:5,10-methylenetetrahydromethanopterin reductase